MTIIDTRVTSPAAFISTSHRTFSGGTRWDTIDDINYRRACEDWVAEYPFTINVSLTFAPRPFDDLRYLEPGDLAVRRWRSRELSPDLTRTPRKQLGALTLSQVERLIERFCRRLGARTRQSIRAIVAIEPHVSGSLHAHGVMAGVRLSPADVLESWPYGTEAQARWLGEGHTAIRGVSYNLKHVDGRDEEESSGNVVIIMKRWTRPDYHGCLEVVKAHDPARAAGLPTWDTRRASHCGQ